MTWSSRHFFGRTSARGPPCHEVLSWNGVSGLKPLLSSGEPTIGGAEGLQAGNMPPEPSLEVQPQRTCSRGLDAFSRALRIACGG